MICYNFFTSSFYWCYWIIYKIYSINDFWLDIRDLWPDSALELGQIKKGILYKLGKKLEKNLYESAKGFIFPVPGFK